MYQINQNKHKRSSYSSYHILIFAEDNLRTWLKTLQQRLHIKRWRSHYLVVLLSYCRTSVSIAGLQPTEIHFACGLVWWGVLPVVTADAEVTESRKTRFAFWWYSKDKLRQWKENLLIHNLHLRQDGYKRCVSTFIVTTSFFKTKWSPVFIFRCR